MKFVTGKFNSKNYIETIDEQINVHPIQISWDVANRFQR